LQFAKKMTRRPRSPDRAEIAAQAAALNAREAAAIRNVTAHAAEYLHTWITDAQETRAPTLASVLLAASRGPACVFTCEHILRLIGSGPSTPLLRRALSLFGPGELQVLHVADGDSLELVMSMLDEAGGDAPHGVALSRAMDPLRAIKCEGYRSSDATAALIERYAATITELRCRVPDHALARCIHLESLTIFWAFTPSVWLGLSQLHTLRGVSFAIVPVAAIAAALPRLHTIHASGGRSGKDSAVYGFYDDLLPRLQSFHIERSWPDDRWSEPSLKPLPLLRDLKWTAARDQDYWVETPVALPSEFYGAQPESLQATLPNVARWLAAVKAARPGSPAEGPLARVRDLWIADRKFASWRLARVLRAAPQLRRLTLEIRGYFEADEETEETEEDAGEADEEGPASSEEVVHPRLRHLVVVEHCEVDCAVMLQRYFPRLRRLTVNDQDYPVSVAQ
jgi:hypothetical protein